MPAPSMCRVHRPLAIRCINRIGSIAEKLRLKRISFSPENLKAAAQRETGLSDFGDDDFEEGLARLTRSLDTEADLHFLGRVVWSRWAKLRLMTRLRMVEAMRQWPDVCRRMPEKPTFILGFPRSGTTLLYNLLACDRSARVPRLWESYRPAPPPARLDEAEVARIRRIVDRALRGARRLAPALQVMHHLGSADAVEECFPLLEPSFRMPSPIMVAHVPSYYRWIRELSTTEILPSYRCYGQGVAMLMDGHPDRRWLSKSPFHAWSVPALLKVFPDARIIHCQRDPMQSVPSTCSLFEGFRSAYTDNHRPRQTGQLIVELHELYTRRFEKARALIDSAHLVDVEYDDLIDDPIGQVRRIHEQLRQPLTAHHRQEMIAWLPRNPYDPQRVGRHVYTAEEFGLPRSRLEQLCV